MSSPSNRLAGLASLYLRQHANNPVNWFPWGDAAFAEATRRSVPLVVSVGYSACHWCHVMAHECFENDGVATVMNRSFVAVKVDREEHPALDSWLMGVCRVLTGSGGWPLNVLLLPDGRPFHAVTYLPRDRWVAYLNRVTEAWIHSPGELLRLAEQVQNALDAQSVDAEKNDGAGGDISGLHLQDGSKLDWRQWFHERMTPWMDSVHGGFGSAPKFPTPPALDLLLTLPVAEAASHARLTLRELSFGGIHDWVGGGFARYSVDSQWSIPHFEKMLYDNGSLLGLYARGLLRFDDCASLFGVCIEGIVSMLKRDMGGSHGCYGASLDADAQGVEGGFHCWTWDELGRVLGQRREAFARDFLCLPEGNWEHGLNLPRLPSGCLDPEQRIKEHHQDLVHLADTRMLRVPPGFDGKAVVEWNAKVVSGLAWAAFAMDRSDWMERAVLTADVLLNSVDSSGVPRLVEPGSPTGSLSDYSGLALTCLDLYRLEGQNRWLLSAERIVRMALQVFPQTGKLFCSHDGRDRHLRSAVVETEDGATASGNGMLCLVLQELGLLLDDMGLSRIAMEMGAAMQASAMRNPVYSGTWMEFLLRREHGLLVVDILDPEPLVVSSKLLTVATGLGLQVGFRRREVSPVTEIQVCTTTACLAPCGSVHEAEGLFRNVRTVPPDVRTDPRVP